MPTLSLTVPGRCRLDVFQLGKFSGKHQDWKPFVAHILGMDSRPVVDLYGKREELNENAIHLGSLAREWSGDDVDPSVLDGLILVKRRDIDSKSKTLASFNFQEEDMRTTSDLIERTEAQIAALNEESYRLSRLVRRIERNPLKSSRYCSSRLTLRRFFVKQGCCSANSLSMTMYS
jgi:uncharacterized protein YydD (DUF2326 family)